MNILVVTDSFSKGGLETHIDTYYKYLSKDNNIIFAFGKYIKDNYLKDAKIISDMFHFYGGATIKEFKEDVSSLVKIIKDNKIDLIHVHPFYCLYPALVAANITSTKIVFTAHGRISLNYFNNPVDTIFYRFGIEEVLNAIFCVSKEGEKWIKPYAKDNSYFLPNLINLDDYEKHEVKNNKRWALVSRLDNDKKEEILKLFDMLDNLDIDFIDVYGSGNAEDEIKDYVKKHSLDKKIEFKGYVSNINEILNGHYNGVMGQGRVVLEALAMNYPTVLMGYGKIAGLIDSKMFDQIKDVNFIPTTVDHIPLVKLQEELLNIGEDNYLREKIEKDFSVKRFDEYINIIKNSIFSSIEDLNNWYNDITLIEDDLQPFYNSSEVFDLLVKSIVPYCSDIELKSLVNAYSKLYYLEKVNDFNNSKINSLNAKLDDVTLKNSNDIATFNDELKANKKAIDEYKSKISNLEKKVVELENVGLRTLIKRAFKNLFKK